MVYDYGLFVVATEKIRCPIPVDHTPNQEPHTNSYGALYPPYKGVSTHFLMFRLRNNCISMFCNLCLPSMTLLSYLEALPRSLVYR